ncbi:MAG: hypothetical protein WDA27_05245 [Actinomycetota bacterium]
MSDKPRTGSVRLMDAMPRPLLVVFLAFSVAALAAVVVLMLRPVAGGVALQDRRPPPRGDFSHGVGSLAPAPVPSVVPTLSPACSAVSGTRLVAGGDGVLRLRSALKEICGFAAGGVAVEVTEAIAGLDGATLRFGGFDVTGAESTADFTTRTVWLNIKFGLRRTPVVELVPVILHDAWHLARASSEVTAEEELGARRAEVEACRQVIPISKWPRWCEDADDLTRLPREDALRLLVSAGYAR